jgi:hypothetical protein
MTLKVNLGGYESVDISLGGSLTVDNTPAAIRTAQRTLMKQHERLLTIKAEELRQLWGSNVANYG